jgi:hypothetical protein
MNEKAVTYLFLAVVLYVGYRWFVSSQSDAAKAKRLAAENDVRSAIGKALGPAAGEGAAWIFDQVA